MYKIYLILADTGGTGQWKVGITTNINKRLQTLRVGNPNISHVETVYEIEDREVAYMVETLVKKRFKEFKINGEWFSYSCLNREIFLDICEKYEYNANVSKQFERDMIQYKNDYR